MKKIILRFTILFITVIAFVSLTSNAHAELNSTVQITTTDVILFDENLQYEIASLSQNSVVTVLSKSNGWTKVNYQSQIGLIESSKLENALAQYLLVQSKTDPIVRVSNTQQSEVLGNVPINSVVKAYVIDSSSYTFVQYGELSGYVQKQLLIKPTAQARIVKAPNGLNVMQTASSSSSQVGQVANGTTVTMLAKLNDWVFVTTNDVAGYVQGSSLKYIPSTNVPKKPSTPKPVVSTKKVALTFDDGPHPKVTQQILRTLKKYDAKATFFVVGDSVKKYPKVLKEVSDAGHEIGNHTFNHVKLTTLSSKQIQSQIQSTDTAVKSVIGQNTTVFRPPYGAYNNSVKKQLKVPNVLWTIDTLDWKHHNPTKTLQVVKANAKNGSIILMHDIHQTTADALDSVLAALQKQGYEFVTVSELMQK